MPVASPDVRDWIERQPAPDRGPLARTWDAAGCAAESPPPDDNLEDAWSRLEAALEAEPPLPHGNATRENATRRARPLTSRPSQRAATDRPASRARRRWIAGLAVAAVALIALVPALHVEVRADGAVLEVALPDGSTATLAPGSEVAYRRGLWGGTRRVEVEGQVALEVATDGRPFVAETFNAEVEVLGTVFDVLAWPGVETAVSLIEGSVRLRSAGGETVLEPGQVSRVAGRGAPTPPVPTDLEAVTAWQRGGFSVVDAPLAAVAEAVAARFGLEVGLGNGVDSARRLTLFLSTAETADAVLGDVAAYLDLRLQAGSGRYDLLPR